MAKKILFVLRILVLIIFCGLVICFYFTDNYVGEAISLFSFMFISLLLSVIKDNMTKTEDGSEGNTKNKPLSRKQKISDIIFIILALFSLLCQFLNFDVDCPYVVIFIISAIVILAIVSEIINYKRNR